MSQFNATRREIVRLFGTGVAGAAMLPSCLGKSLVVGDVAMLPDFRRSGDRDDTDALHRAISTGLPIHAPAARGSGTGGRYVIGSVGDDNLPSGFKLTGDGIDRTIIARSYVRANSFILYADSGSADTTRNLTGIAISDLTFEDEVVTRGFSEFSYLVMLSGVTGAQIDRVGFRGFRGDGLYVGSSTVQANERHNLDVAVRDCHFDGVDANNRNGISILDCDGLLIERCRFENVTRVGGKGAADPMDSATGPPMPGAIDLEPEPNGFAIIRNIVIRDNRFVGGGGYAVAVTLQPNDAVHTPQHAIRIEENIVERRHGGFSASGYRDSGAVTSDRPYAIDILSNQVSQCVKPFLVQGIRGLTIAQNSFIDCGEMAELGYQATNAAVSVRNNDFERDGTIQGYAVWVRSVDGLDITGNRFVDCGLTDGRLGIAIGFVEGVMRKINIVDNRFSSPSGRGTEAVTIFHDAKVDRGSVTARANRTGHGILDKGPTLGI